MARQSAKEVVDVAEIPAEVIGAIVEADLIQIEVDARTHPDTFARERIIKAVSRLRQIAQGGVDRAELAA
jgi:hypothetical protein